MFPLWAQAMFWGGVGGIALVIGAVAGYAMRVPRRVTAGVMAFGSGVLISALAFELMEKAYERGGFWASAVGFLGGAVVYTIANMLVSRHGAKHRKRSGGQQPSEQQEHGSGLAIAIGALLDGIPESMVIGLSLLKGGAVGVVAVTAVFLSNIPEGLSSSVGMKRAGRSPLYVFGVWGTIAAVSALASWAGFVLFDGYPPSVIAGTTATAAGAILSMLVDTMIPEAFDDVRDYAGAITVAGFLAAFALSKLGG